MCYVTSVRDIVWQGVLTVSRDFPTGKGASAVPRTPGVLSAHPESDGQDGLEAVVPHAAGDISQRLATNL